MWQIRMLGRFEVLSPEGRPASFRSRKVGSLLAFLALNKGREISNATLQDLFWPDSDGDRQSQSLRRAIADLRQALEDGGGRVGVVRTDRGKTALEAGAFETDVERFEELLDTPPEAPDFVLKAAEALGLYGGPLLAPFEEDWVYAYRRQYEELYCGSVEALCSLLVDRGQAREAIRIANFAIILAPLREECYVASIRAYAAMENRSMALQQYEALEKMLDDQFGQTPSEAALAAVDAPALSRPALPSAVPELSLADGVESVGGAIDAESRFYIERAADGQVSRTLESGEAVILVFGPRQVGKTSLLARTASIVRPSGVNVAVTDFQALGKSEIERPATLYRALVHSLATQLGLTYEPSWNEWIGPNSNLDAQVDALLKQTHGPVCWAMDEVDRLFGTDYADDFFGLVRSWHNRRALDPEGPWKRLSLLISYATEAHLFIKDLNQSPFNVGVRICLQDFSEDEVRELQGRYAALPADAWKEVHHLTNGHPFLSRRAFAFLAEAGAIGKLQEVASSPEGPFGDHFRRLLAAITQDPETLAEVKRMLRGEPFEGSTTRYRLQSAGFISISKEGKNEFRVPAYEAYLSSALSG